MEPINIIYTTDWHLCSRCPGKRSQDNFFDLQMKKVDEIIHLAVTHKVNAIIHGGDFFDSPKIDYWLLNAIISKFNTLKENCIDVYLVPGSHDIYGYRTDSIHSTAIGALEATGLIRILNGHTSVFCANVLAVPATLQHDLALYKDVLSRDPEIPMLVISHNIITPYPVPYTHTLLRDMPGNGVVYLLGHYHQYFMVKDNNNVFVNPGPLVRTDISEQEHEPCIVQLTFLDNKLKNIKKIPLISAKKDVFVQESVGRKTFDFVDSIRSTTFQYCDLFDLTQKIAQSVNMPKDVVDNALERLEKAQRELS